MTLRFLFHIFKVSVCDTRTLNYSHEKIPSLNNLSHWQTLHKIHYILRVSKTIWWWWCEQCQWSLNNEIILYLNNLIWWIKFGRGQKFIFFFVFLWNPFNHPQLFCIAFAIDVSSVKNKYKFQPPHFQYEYEREMH